MGLQSALSTALTGLTAAETQIDVVGNNLANAQTVGFKASETVFATQFLQTLGLGSAPNANSGGTNPRQTGLGTQVAEVTPDFRQGTIEISGSPSDMAIQGDGFFIIKGESGDQLYTRNGIFKINSQSELVTVNGGRLMGYGIDEFYQIQATELVPLTIPIGSAADAKATENAILEGSLRPNGDVATTAEVIESVVFGDATIPQPDTSLVAAQIAPLPNESLVASSSSDTGGALQGNTTYQYRFAFVDSSGQESVASTALSVAIPLGDGIDNNQIHLNGLPTTTSNYTSLNIYRTEAGGSDFFRLAAATPGGSFVDDGSLALDLGQPLNEDVLTGGYSYYVTYFDTATGQETRPTSVSGNLSLANGRAFLDNLPTPPTPGPNDRFPAYDKVRIYRNSSNNENAFYRVATLDPGQSYTDNTPDAVLVEQEQLDFDGPRAQADTLLINTLRRDDTDYEALFQVGTFELNARKGGQKLDEKTFEITDSTTMQEYIDFLEEALGIQKSSGDAANPMPGSENAIIGDGASGLLPGATITNDGRIRVVSNNGTGNAISLLASTVMTPEGNPTTPNQGFGSIQEAVGESATTDFLVYDSLGLPIQVRLTAVLEARDGNLTTYRWFAESPDNDPSSGAEVSIGTGLIQFDADGNYVTSSNATLSIDRRNIPSLSPLEIDLDFTRLTALPVGDSTINASRQDGSAPGKLNSFLIGEDGLIRGSFSNGVSQILGQVRLARFANPVGLEQRGQNMFAQGANSGLAVVGNPGQEGIGTIISGAVELSNTDIGENLIDLVLATTQYRGNTRVVTTAQQLLDELLNLRR